MIMEKIGRKECREKFSILIAENADECEHFAAEELQKYIRSCLHVKLNITKSVSTPQVLSLGKTAARAGAACCVNVKDLKNDGFVIFSDGKNVYFDAATSRGILYAAYEYVERFFGVRFLTAKSEHVPKSDALPIPDEEIVSEPSFAMRTYLTADVFQEHASIPFLAKTRTKDVFTEIPESVGGPVHVYGRNVSHNFHYYVPFEVYGNEHPEFYRFFYENEEILPTIDITNGITEDGKLDESMPISVAKIVVDEMIKDLHRYPDVDIFMLTQEDGRHYFEDERNTLQEQKYKRSGMLVRFCNVIVRELNRYAREHMGGRVIRIMTFAYDYASEAPVYERDGQIYPLDATVIADENLIIQFALFSNGVYDYFSEKQIPAVRKSMREWRYVAKRFWFWAYDISFYRYLGYFDSFDNIQKNVLGFKNYGIEYLCMQGPHDSHSNWQANIRGYVYRKLMWDCSLDAQKLMDEYIDLYYASAASAVREVMQKFHSHYQKLLREGCDLTFITRGTHTDARFNPKEMLEECVTIIESAEDELLCSDSSQKHKNELYERLEQVKATPLMLLVDHFDEYYPNQPEKKERYYQKYHKCMREGNLDMSGERWSMRQYYREIGGIE